MAAYLDSCVVIYLIEGAPDRQQRVEAAVGTSGLCVSEMVRLECRVGPLKQRNSALLVRYERFFSNPDLVMLPITREVFDRAAELRAGHGLKTPDALHAAAAITAGCDTLWTNDRRLAALEPGLRIGVVG